MPNLRPSAFTWDEAWMHHRDCLPHLRQINVIYFVTARLADSIPQAKLDALRERRDTWLKANPLPHTPEQKAEFRKIWTLPMELMLDNGHGKCELQRQECRDFLEATMRHDDGKTYQLGDFVIMPNHLHVLVHVLEPGDLSDILQAWKSISARRINKFLNRRGTLWQAEAFDHIVRSAEYWQRFKAYIRRNPARLPPESFTLGCGSLALET